MRRVLSVTSLAMCLSLTLCHAQAPLSFDPITRGTGGSFEKINQGNGGVNLSIPIVNIKGRGGADFSYALNYSSKIWQTQYAPAWPSYYYQWRPNDPWVVSSPGNSLSSDMNASIIDQCEDNNYNTQDIWAYPANVSSSIDSASRTPAVAFEGADLCNSQWSPQWANYVAGHTASLPSISYLFNGYEAYRSPDGSVVGMDTNGNRVNPDPNNATQYRDSLGNIVATWQYVSATVTRLTLQDGRVFTFNWTTIYATTAFSNPTTAQNCSNCSIKVLSSIALPDGTSWSFEYEPNSYGQLKKVTLPTGGYISYTYQVQSNFLTGTDGLVVASRAENAGGGTNTSTYAYNIVRVNGVVTERQVTRTSPLGDTTTTTFKPPPQDYSMQEFSETDVVYRSGASQVLMTTHNDWACDTIPSFVDVQYQYVGVRAGIGNCRITDRWTTIHDGAQPLTKKIHYDYDSSLSGTFPDVAYTPNSWYGGVHYSNFTTTRGNITRVLEYDWGTGGAAGALLRQTETDYLTTNAQNGNIDYTAVSVNIVNRPKLVTIKDGSGNVKAKTEFQYDGTTLTQTSGVPQHDYTAYPYTNRTRGNLTKVRKWLDTNNTWQERTLSYDDLGNLLLEQDPLGHSTSYDYSDRWADAGCQPSSNSRAYLTTATNALGHQLQQSWGACNGVLRVQKDQNDINATRTGTVYAYDSSNRLDLVTATDGGATDYIYQDATTTEVRVKLDASRWTDTWIRVDGFGRTIQEATAVPSPDNWVLNATCYDALGRVGKKTYPVYSTGGFNSSPCTNLAGDSFTYDALDRPLTTTHPDGSYSYQEYSTKWHATYDESGKARVFGTDALGRLFQVSEPHETTGVTTYWTTHSYDALDNLLQVVQNGDPNQGSQRIRTFTYNSLSQLLTAANPESGTVTYGYNTDGNLTTVTDARSITITDAYDALHRVTSTTYSDSTPSKYFYYDEGSIWGVSPQNPIGRLTHNTGANGYTADILSYDPMGRVVTKWQATPSIAGQGSYITNAAYNLDGSMAWLQYPSGRKVTFGYDIAGRQYRGDFADFNGTAVGYNYFYNYFHPNGAVSAMYHANGTVDWLSLNCRLQPWLMQVTSGSTTLINREYAYTATGPGQCQNAPNNGNVLYVGDLLWNSTHGGDNARSQYFTYDKMNRLINADEGPTSGVGRWGQSYTIDPWGNLKQISNTKGSSGMLSVSINSNNRFNGYGYDAAGNMTADLAHTYNWDAESRLTGIDSNATSYTQDANGLRVRKLTGSDWTEYVYFGSEVIAEKKPGASIYSATFTQSGLSAFYPNQVADADPSTHGWHTDSSSAGSWLKADFGSATVVTSARIYANSNTYVGSYSVQYSDDDANWTTAGSIAPNNQGWNASSWAHSQPHRYWRLYLTNTPGVGPWLQELQLLPGGGWTDYIYSDDRRVATAAATASPGVTEFYHSDHLGSARVITNAQGMVIPGSDGTFLPFGEEFIPTTSGNHFKFTGHERDGESGLDDTWFRKFASWQGRWKTPDLLAGDLSDPQSLNRYSYVTNRPIIFFDPLGLYGNEAGGGNESTRCIMDGVDIGCGQAASYLRAGAAFLCGSLCSSLRQDKNTGKYQYESWGLKSSSSQVDLQGNIRIYPVYGVIWVNFCNDCIGSTLYHTGNFAAGAGDVLSFGLTAYANKQTGADEVINRKTITYVAGAATGAVLQQVILGAATGPGGYISRSVINHNRYARLGWSMDKGKSTYRFVVGGGKNRAHLDLYPKPAGQAIKDFVKQLRP